MSYNNQRKRTNEIVQEVQQPTIRLDEKNPVNFPMTMPELMYKMQEFYKVVKEFDVQKEKLDTMLNRVFKIETTLKNFITNESLEQTLNFLKDDLESYTDIKVQSLETKIKNQETLIYPRNELQEILNKKVQIETIDKLQKNVQGLKMEIVKSIEIKMNVELAEFKIDLGKKLSIDDVQHLVLKEEFEFFKKQVDNLDMQNQAVQFNSMIDKKFREISKNNPSIPFHEIDMASDQSKSYASELEDDYPVEKDKEKENNKINERKLETMKVMKQSSIKRQNITPVEKNLSMKNRKKNAKKEEPKKEDHKKEEPKKVLNLSEVNSLANKKELKPNSIPLDKSNSNSQSGLKSLKSNTSLNQEEVEKLSNKPKPKINRADSNISLQSSRSNVFSQRGTDLISDNTNVIQDTSPVNTVQFKALQDQIDNLKSQVASAVDKAMEAQDSVMEIFVDFKKVQKTQEAEGENRKEIERKIGTVDKMYKQMEGDFEKSQAMNEQIRHNIERTDDLISSIKEEVSQFETKVSRNNERNTKSLVRFKIELDEVKIEFASFKKENSSKIDLIHNEIGKNIVNKRNIETNFENIINIQGSKIKNITNDIDSIKVEQEKLRKPMTEQVDLLNQELISINSFQEYSSNIVNDLIQDFRSIIVNTTTEQEKEEKYYLKDKSDKTKKLKKLDKKIHDQHTYVSTKAFILPSIIGNDGSKEKMNKDKSEVSIQNGISSSVDLRKTIGLAKQGLQSVDPSIPSGNKNNNFVLNKFESLKKNRVNMMNQTFY